MLHDDVTVAIENVKSISTTAPSLVQNEARSADIASWPAIILRYK